MELMSSLLLCILVGMVRQTLGQSINNIDIRRKLNSTIYLKDKPTINKKVLLNLNGPPLVNMINEIQIVFSDINCRSCIDCMERAIKAYKANHYFTDNRPSTEEFQNSLLNNYYKIDNLRVKRNTDNKTKSLDFKETKTKLKSKNKVHKSMIVTKYNIDGEIYALKVKGTNNQNNFEQGKEPIITSSDCHIYSIKKTLACDSPEAESIIANDKRKTKKERRSEKTRKEKKINYVITTTSKITAMYRKRQVDDTQVPENDMTSIEELMY